MSLNITFWRNLIDEEAREVSELRSAWESQASGFEAGWKKLEIGISGSFSCKSFHRFLIDENSDPIQAGDW